MCVCVSTRAPSIPHCLLFVSLILFTVGGEEVSFESVRALGLLVGGMDASGVVRPLEELATVPPEAKAAGYSKVHMAACA